MQPIGLNELRARFLKFFEGKGHLCIPGFPLIPKNDKSLLLINSGMAPLKPYFTGAVKPPNVRMATCQKCIRTQDIDNVGFTSRHATFFEMLGNFSFGDYFKRESIAWGWEFMTVELAIPADLLYASVYLEDDEAYGIWRDEIGLPESRIVRLGKEDNFWEHGLGPCGPCSEIYFDRGAKYGCGEPNCAPGCECDRYIEVWNHVFTQFDRKDDGSYDRLKSTNIDTGMGLERLACVIQGVDSIFEVDTIRALLEAVCACSNVIYGNDSKADVSIRIITDHIRSSTMMASDGIIPSNEGRGYVLRRLLRRAARHGRLLGINGSFLGGLSDKVVAISSGAYPELAEKSAYVKKIISNEEERFSQTLDQGLSIFMEGLQETKESGRSAIDGEIAFKLHDTYGFPIDLTREIAAEEGFGLDEEKFSALMGEQKAKARAALKDKDTSAWEQSVLVGLDKIAPTEFVGYEQQNAETTILCIYNEAGSPAEIAAEGDNVTIVLGKTPFYAESGGQLADVGTIATSGGEVYVFNCEKTGNGIYLHLGQVVSGAVAIGEEAGASIETARRSATEKNHTATHLLQSALKRVLGDHVNQSGSQVGQDKLRFDFHHFEQVSGAQLDEIERLVNDKIFASLPVGAIEMGLAEAREAGAQALFGEKYGDVVRVVSAGDFSRELCGGTHVGNTVDIGLFAIRGEGGVAAGVRRIEALTGEAAYNYLRQAERTLSDASLLVKSAPEELPQRIESLLRDIKEREREIEHLTDRIIARIVDDAIDNAEAYGPSRLLAMRADELDAEGIKKLADGFRGRDPSIVAVLATGAGGRADFVAAAGSSAVGAGVDAGKIVKLVAAAAGGNGGGRRDMARAGCKDPSLIDAALATVPAIVKQQLNIEQ